MPRNRPQPPAKYTARLQLIAAPQDRQMLDDLVDQANAGYIDGDEWATYSSVVRSLIQEAHRAATAKDTDQDAPHAA